VAVGGFNAKRLPALTSSPKSLPPSPGCARRFGPRPEIGEHRDAREHRRLLCSKRRQIEQLRMHRTDGRRGRARTAAGRRQRQVEHFRIDRERAHGAAFGVGNFLDFDQPPPTIDGQPDHVAERQR
jgi:hypothetical protein